MPKKNLNKPTGSAGGKPKRASVTPPSPTQHFMSVAQAAHCVAVSTKSIRRAIKDGRLSATRLGRRVLISRGALHQFETALIAAGLILPTPRPKP